MKLLKYWRDFHRIRSASNGYSPIHDMKKRPFPNYIQVQTVNVCNARCVMCPYDHLASTRPAGQMEESLWKKIIEEVAAHSEVKTFIPMLQNEPFLDKHILERVADFKHRSKGKVHVELVTHGVLLTPNCIEALRKSELDLLSISVDSVNPETYKKIRVGLDYEEVMRNIDRLVKAKLKTRIVIRMVRQKANEHEVKQFAQFWKERGIEAVVWDANNRSGAVSEFETIRISEEGKVWSSFISDSLISRWIPHCPVPFNFVSILHNGDVIVCGSDWLHESIIGNVVEHSISELWNSEVMQRVRRLHYERKAQEVSICRKCSVWQKHWATGNFRTEGDEHHETTG